MKGFKLLKILATLPKEELRGVKKAVISPLFNTNERTIKFFNAIRPYHPNFPSDLKFKKKIFQKVFPSEEFNAYKMRRLFSDLREIVEAFLIFTDYQKNRSAKQKHLTQIYGRRNLYTIFEKEIEQDLQELEQENRLGSEYYFEKFHLIKSKYLHPLFDKYNAKDSTVEELMQQLDNGFAFEKIRLAIGLKNRATIFNQPYDLRFISEIEQEFKKGLLKNDDLFQLYLQALFLLEERAESDFDLYEELLFRLIEFIDKEDQLVLFYNGVNYAIRRANRGEEEFSANIFEWFNFGIEKKIVIQNGNISGATFGNIVFYGCKLNQFEWVSQFIENYKIHLKEDVRDDIVSYNLAIINFYKKDFGRVVDFLSNHSFSPQYLLRTKILLIRTYFELFSQSEDYFSLLMNTLKAHKTYIYRNKTFAPNRLENQLEFVKILEGLAKQMVGKNKKSDIKKWLKIQYRKRKTTVGKNWLLSKF